MSPEELAAQLKAKPITPEELAASLRNNDSGIVGDLIGSGEVVATLATSIPAEIASGLVGVGGLAAKGVSDTLKMLGLEKAAQYMDPGDLRALVEKYQGMLTHTPRTQEGQAQLKTIGQALEPVAEGLQSASQTLGDVGYAVGGPVGGAIAASAPEAALEIVSGVSLPKGMAGLARSKAAKLVEKAREIKPRTTKDIADTIMKASADDIILDVDINPRVVEAIDELGIDKAPIASYLSKNQQYIEVEQALASLRGSSLSKQSRDFIDATAERAAKLIDDFGGEKRGEFSSRFLSETTASVDDLFESSNAIYNEIDSILDQSAKVSADNTMSFINSEAAKLGGLNSELLKRVKNSLETVKERRTGYTGVPMEVIKKQPTYGMISKVRQDIGQAISKRSGPFKDGETGFLKKLYANLRQDQDLYASTQNVLDQLKAADGLTIQRKALEGQLESLLGKKLQKAIEPQVAAAVKGLASGKTPEFKKLISDIPEAYRQPAVMTALREVMSGPGLGKADYSANKFTQFWEKLPDSSKSMIFENIPEGSKRAIDNLYQVSRAISKAEGLKVQTGIVGHSLKMFERNQGFMSKLVGGAAGVTIRGASHLLPGGSLVADWVGNFLKQNTDRARLSAELLGSDKFRQVIAKAVEEGVHNGNVSSASLLKKQKLIESSEVYKKWAKTLSESELAELNSIGLVSFLIPENKEEE